MRRIWLPLLVTASSTVGAQAPVITKKLSIGCESCAGPMQFASIYDVSVSPTGQVLVTDRDAPMLRLFDGSGKSLWAVGPKGKGPGEYIMPYRATLVDGGVVVIDMTNSRITELDAQGKLVRSTPVTGFATTVGVTRRADIAFGLDSRSAFRIGHLDPKGTSIRVVADFPGSMQNKSVALAPDGTMAVALDGLKYEIKRLDAAGKPISPIIREIERPRRTAVEEAEYRERLNRDLSLMQAEMKKQGHDGKVKAPDIPPSERGLKPHIAVDGLRYDDAGQLWVRTMRGDETKTVFDVFAPSGAFLGEVTVPARVSNYAVAGSYLATAGENEDGMPVVTVWTVK
jgi:sugar lactone lactonase YvrE